MTTDGTGGSSFFMSKVSAREALQKKRDAISKNAAVLNGERLLPYLQNFKSFDHWLLYSPMKNELATKPIFEWLRHNKRSVYFPKASKTLEMDFFRVDEWKEESVSWAHAPAAGSQKLLHSNAIALIPGVGFTNTGHRLGFGMGHYDRFLARYPDILRVGLAYDFQVEFSLWESEPHDEVMDYVMTPAGIWSSKRGL